MTGKELLQQEKGLEKNILDLLKFFKESRELSWAQIGAGANYSGKTLTKVYNGHQEGGERLLRALEMFFRLDNLNQVANIERTIEDLTRQKAVLREQTIENFYAERLTSPAATGHIRAEFNEGTTVSSPEKAVHVKFGVQRGAASEARRTPSKTKKDAPK